MENGKPTRVWWTAKEAAAYLGVHVKTLYKYVRKSRNKPPFRQFGKKSNYRFPIEDFKQWAAGPQK